MRLLHVLVGVLAAVAATAFVGGAAAQTSCVLTGTSTDEVLPGVTLTWDSSFLCADAPPSGTYAITVNVSNAAGGAEAVTIERLELSHTTPRPRGIGPEATATATGLPLTVLPGESGSFQVSGEYALVSTDEGAKANLHLRALGVGAMSGDPFELGINVQIRAPGATEDGSGADEEGGSPLVAGGPPPWTALAAAEAFPRSAPR